MTIANRTTLACPNCGQQLGVPTDRGDLRLTCPICRYSWDWAGSSASEVLDLPFRCAQSGSRFHVVFGREKPSQKFRILIVIDDPVVPHGDTSKKAAQA